MLHLHSIFQIIYGIKYCAFVCPRYISDIGLHFFLILCFFTFWTNDYYGLTESRNKQHKNVDVYADCFVPLS